LEVGIELWNDTFLLTLLFSKSFPLDAEDDDDDDDSDDG
jgi:hypothetical protein